MSLGLLPCLIGLALAPPLALQSAQEAPRSADDEIVTTREKSHRGVILLQTEEEVVLDQDGRTRRFKRKDIQSVAGPRVAYARYYDTQLEWAYSSESSPEDVLDLVEWCEEEGLFRGVQMHYWQVLNKDPENAVAHNALGHRLEGGQWIVPLSDAAAVPYEQFLARQGGDGKPWRFSTEHFDVQSSAPLKQTLLAAATAEMVYFQFYAHFQEIARFHEQLQPLPLHLYASRAQGYPSLGPKIEGHFETLTSIIHAYFEKGEARNLVRLVCHALQDRSVDYDRMRIETSYPGWLYEGIGSYLESSFRSNDGIPTFHQNVADLNWLRIHQQASPPIKLKDLVRLSRVGLSQHKQSQLAFAQSYSLVHYLLHGDDPQLRTGLGNYMRRAFDEANSSQAMKKSFGKKLHKELEENWTTFVHQSVDRKSHH